MEPKVPTLLCNGAPHPSTGPAQKSQTMSSAKIQIAMAALASALVFQSASVTCAQIALSNVFYDSTGGRNLVISGSKAYVASSALSLFGLPIALLVPFIPEVVRGTIVVTTSTLGSSLVTPIWQLTFVLIYLDLRVRKENLDLWQLADQADAAVPR